MTKLYKLTTQDNRTRKGYYNETIWGPSVTHSGTGNGELCGPGFIHGYTSPLLALLLNPIHANIINPKLWVCEGEIIKSDMGLKVGCLNLTTLNEIPLPPITINQRVAFSILCALEVYKDKSFQKWANYWLNGTNRSKAAAMDAAGAARSAESAAMDAAMAAAGAARSAAESAARAARSAAMAAAGAARSAAESAAGAAEVAARAAEVAAEVVRAAKIGINLIELAERVLTYE